MLRTSAIRRVESSTHSLSTKMEMIKIDCLEQQMPSSTRRMHCASLITLTIHHLRMTLAIFSIKRSSIYIRKELDAVVIDQCDSSRQINYPKFGFDQSLEKFDVLSTNMVSQLIQKSAKKSYALDPMPTSLVVKSLNELLPAISCMINSSLSLDYFPSAWKSTLVDPRLKKTGQPASLSNLRSKDSLYLN